MKEFLLKAGTLSCLWGLIELLLPSDKWKKLVRAALGLLLLETIVLGFPGVELEGILENMEDLSETSVTAVSAAGAMEDLLGSELETKIQAILSREDVRLAVTIKTDETGRYFAEKARVNVASSLSDAQREAVADLLQKELDLSKSAIQFITKGDSSG